MRDKAEIQRAVLESSGIHISNKDPIWALYDLMDVCEKDFLETYGQVNVELLQSLKDGSREYSKELLEASQRYAETILEVANKLDLTDLKEKLEAASNPKPVQELEKSLLDSRKIDASTSRMTQLFFANICVLALNLVIFLATAYLR